MSSKLPIYTTLDAFKRLQRVVIGSGKNKATFDFQYDAITGFETSVLSSGTLQAVKAALPFLDLVASKYTANIHNITNIETIETIQDINHIILVDEIGIIDNITEIDNISNIGSIPQINSTENLLTNGSFATKSLKGWKTTAATVIYTETTKDGDYPTCKIPAGESLYQYISPIAARNALLSFRIYSGGGSWSVDADFATGGGSDTYSNFSVGGYAWAFDYATFTSDRKINTIGITNTGLNDIYVTFFHLKHSFEDNEGCNSVLPKAKGKTTIVKSGQGNNTPNVFYTVTAGKTFYFHGGSLTVTVTAASKGYLGNLQADTAGDGVYRTLCAVYGNTNAPALQWGGQNNISTPAGLPFPAGTRFRTISDDAAIFAYGTILGYEE